MIKLLKTFKYITIIQKTIASKLTNTETRMLLIMIGSFFAVHIFSCFFYLEARLNDFGEDTWVCQNDMIDLSVSSQWYQNMYWAFQTLTTVGYGDFGAYNTIELWLSLTWMFIGVAFYTFVVGSLTTIITDSQTMQDILNAKLMALDEFAEKTNLEKSMHRQIRMFFSNNYKELFQRVDEEQMQKELPISLVEELFYHQFGSLIYKFEFFQEIPSDMAWAIVRNLRKIMFH